MVWRATGAQTTWKARRGMVGKLRLAGKNADRAVKFLEATTGILKESGVNFALDGGTLLGIVREDRFLPWDNDLDLVVLSSERDRLASAMMRFLAKGFSVTNKPFLKNSGPVCRGDWRICKVRNHWILLDIIIKYPDGDHYAWEVVETLKRVPKKFYDTYDSIDFRGKRYPIPAFAEEYLTFRYGDWRTPKQDYDVRKDDGAIALVQNGQDLPPNNEIPSGGT
jgi:lipopolysaccharide cholinephosphotransferase